MNIHWVTHSRNCRNRVSNHAISCRGETKLLCEWADVTGIPAARIATRINRGWSVERALTTPPTRWRGPILEVNGSALSITQLAALTGLSSSTVKTRLTRGWSIERIMSTAPYEWQHNNERMITFSGYTHSISEWARLYGLKRHTLSQRLRHGWNISDALTTPVKTQLRNQD